MSSTKTYLQFFQIFVISNFSFSKTNLSKFPPVMIEDQRKRMEKAVADMIQDMYKTHLRKMQSEMHLCAVNCCDDHVRQPNLDSVQNCIENCAAPLMKAQDLVQHELGQFQSRLQNCVMVSWFVPLKILKFFLYNFILMTSNVMMMFVVVYL